MIWGLNEIKIEIPDVNEDLKIKIKDKLIDKSELHNRHIQPIMIVEAAEGVSAIRSKALYEIIKNDGKLTFKMDTFPSLILCTNCLNELGIDYVIKSDLFLSFEDKAENLAVLSTSKFSGTTINENLKGKIIKSTRKHWISDFTFDFNQDSFHDITNEKLSKCFKSCTLSYERELVDFSNEIYTYDVIELKKDEVLNFEFKEKTLEEIKGVLEYLNELLNMDEDEIEELFEKNFNL